MKRVEELLMAPDATSPHIRLVKAVFGGMRESDLADLVLDSPSMTLRLRAAEELALNRGDRHPGETFLELIGEAQGIATPPRAEDAIRNGVHHSVGGLFFIDGEIRPLMRGGATSIEGGDGRWSAAFQEPSSLVVKVGGRRHEVHLPFRRPTLAAAADERVIVCSLYEPYSASSPLSIAFSMQTGEEIWRRESLAPAKPLMPRGLRQDLELVIRGDRVYLFGVCSQSMFIECISLADGGLIGVYRMPATFIAGVPAKVLKTAAER
ncbi:hypothetical protein [Planctomyces sp. SH-PL14]|uniref:hypothetical protein n=1 Tax=Planctomyces sp. SH-PL14 TaxID=1632864 RepID=UPI0012E91C0E|nr:hypothetical protein [Planctomyces sp. SH-PL14]